MCGRTGRRSLSRSSHEERGLKLRLELADSLDLGRSSHEERGLKFFDRRDDVTLEPGRSSHEERGLKYRRDAAGLPAPVSLLA